MTPKGFTTNHRGFSAPEYGMQSPSFDKDDGKCEHRWWYFPGGKACDRCDEVRKTGPR